MAQLTSSEAVQSAKKGLWATYVVFAFCIALVFGFFKGLLIGPVAALVLIVGNIGVLLGLFPAHLFWTILTILKTNVISTALKIVLLFSLPIVFALWLALGAVGSVLVGLGYGFVSPWMATFDAFRLEGERNKFAHGITDGTWGTIKGSCTVVRDFADFSFHSIPLYLKELREAEEAPQPFQIRFDHLIAFSPTVTTATITELWRFPRKTSLRLLKNLVSAVPSRFVDVPACILVAIVGIIVDLPLYTLIAIVKSPYMLFKGWQRLLHDLISGQGPFSETSCVPIAGLIILFWPIVVIACIVLAFFSGIFFGLYGAVVVYQERSLRRGLAYVIATVAEFDEYTNDWLYLAEGTIFPSPQYRKNKASSSMELSQSSNTSKVGRPSSGTMEPPALLVPSLAPSRSIREVIHEVKMVQIWDELMMACEDGGKQLLDSKVIMLADLNNWTKTRGNKGVVGVGLPSYCLLDSLVESIRAGSSGIVLSNGVEVNHLNRPQDRLLDWFFQPVMLLKEQIRVINLEEGELRFLEKLVLFGDDSQRMESWRNGSVPPQDALRNAQIQAISRRLIGMARSISKFPTYRRRFQRVVKVLIAHSLGKDYLSEKGSFRAMGSIRASRSTKAMQIEV